MSEQEEAVPRQSVDESNSSTSVFGTPTANIHQSPDLEVDNVFFTCKDLQDELSKINQQDGAVSESELDDTIVEQTTNTRMTGGGDPAALDAAAQAQFDDFKKKRAPRKGRLTTIFKALRDLVGTRGSRRAVSRQMSDLQRFWLEIEDLYKEAEAIIPDSETAAAETWKMHIEVEMNTVAAEAEEYLDSRKDDDASSMSGSIRGVGVNAGHGGAADALAKAAREEQRRRQIHQALVKSQLATLRGAYEAMKGYPKHPALLEKAKGQYAKYLDEYEILKDVLTDASMGDDLMDLLQKEGIAVPLTTYELWRRFEDQRGPSQGLQTSQQPQFTVPATPGANSPFYGFPQQSAQQRTANYVQALTNGNQFRDDWISSVGSRPNYQTGSNFSQRSRIKVELKIFEGDVRKWPHWVSLFRGMVDKSDMSYEEKLAILQNHMGEDPGKLINHLHGGQEAYATALSMLASNYGDSRELRRKHMDDLRRLPPAKNEEKSMNSFVLTVTGMIAALAADPRQDMVVVIEEVVDKLPMERRLEWIQFSRRQGCDATAEQFLGWLREMQMAFKGAARLATFGQPPPSQEPKEKKQDRRSEDRRSERGN